MTPANNLMVLLSIFTVACTHRIALLAPFAPEAPSCRFQVTDARPDPEAIYFRGSSGTGRAIVEPPIAEVIRKSVCAALLPAQAAGLAKFVITDFECTVTGFFELRYVVDLRGRLETPERTASELRSGNMLLTSNGYMPAGCENAAKPVTGALVKEIVRAMQTN